MSTKLDNYNTCNTAMVLRLSIDKQTYPRWFTKEELELWQHFANGKSARVVAQETGVSKQVINESLKSIKQKTNNFRLSPFPVYALPMFEWGLTPRQFFCCRSAQLGCFYRQIAAYGGFSANTAKAEMLNLRKKIEGVQAIRQGVQETDESVQLKKGWLHTHPFFPQTPPHGLTVPLMLTAVLRLVNGYHTPYRLAKRRHVGVGTAIRYFNMLDALQVDEKILEQEVIEYFTNL